MYGGKQKYLFVCLACYRIFGGADVFLIDELQLQYYWKGQKAVKNVLADFVR